MNKVAFSLEEEVALGFLLEAYGTSQLSKMPYLRGGTSCPPRGPDSSQFGGRQISPHQLLRVSARISYKPLSFELGDRLDILGFMFPTT